MEKLTPSEITTLLLGLAVLLGFARAFGELFNKYKQPAIVGELLAGIILGPTIFGALFPDLFAAIFPFAGPVALGYQTIITLAVVLLLLIAGLEIDLSIVWRQGKAALLVSLFGVVIPFALGFGLAYMAPFFWGMEPGSDTLTFSLFIGIALSISALPVIAKIMLDLNLFKTDVGMLVMGAAMLNDLIGWLGFSLVLGMIGVGGDHGGFSIGMTVGLTLGLFAFMLTIGRYLIDKTIPWIQAELSWPGGILGFTLVLMFLGAALTEYIGVHAVFGAFLVGIVVGDSSHLREKTRTIMNQFVTYIFAPIFLVAIGLEANFLESFNLLLVVSVLIVAFVGKFAGCLLGGWLGGLSRSANLAVSFGMNARGTMEIILALLALQYGVIGEEVFVALVVLAVLSSLIAGPLMQYFIKRPKEWNLEDLINEDTFVPELEADTREGVIRELSKVAAEKAGLDADEVARAVLSRERLISSSIGNEIAVPQAGIEDLETPVLAVGLSREDLDFDSPDGKPTHLVFLLLTDRDDNSAKMQLMGQIANLFKDEKGRNVIYEGESMDVIRAYIKTEGPSEEEKEDYGLEREMRSVLREKGMREEDPYEKVTGRAAVLDIDDSDVSYDEIVKKACSSFAEKLDMDQTELYDTFSEKRDLGAIPIGRGTALKHIRVKGDISPEIVLVRIKNGLPTDKEHFEDLEGNGQTEDKMLYALIFLVSSDDQASQHLRFLAHIVEMIDNKRFLERWKKAEDKEALRHLILRDERFISFTLRSDNQTKEMIGKEIKDLDLPGESLISMLKRDGNIKIPHGSTQLNEGDRLLIVGEQDDIKELKELDK